MKYKHYAPDADLKIVEGDEAKVVEYINDNVNRLISQGYKSRCNDNRRRKAQL